MAKQETKNSVIDQMLEAGSSTEDILEAVQKQFEGAEVASVKRQIYSRRHVLKTRQVPA